MFFTLELVILSDLLIVQLTLYFPNRKWIIDPEVNFLKNRDSWAIEPKKMEVINRRDIVPHSWNPLI
jgi:hypothetical protein